MIYLILSLGLIACLLSVISPRTVWYLRYGWRYKNAEPSDLSLVVTRISGVLGIVLVAVVALLASASVK
ncbi:MAG TPA: DUF6199 family natural product biosynthesis protein [Pirellulales bacterium]|jgi:hypothetical protein